MIGVWFLRKILVRIYSERLPDCHVLQPNSYNERGLKEDQKRASGWILWNFKSRQPGGYDKSWFSGEIERVYF